jgi:hypothetical protein
MENRSPPECARDQNHLNSDTNPSLAPGAGLVTHFSGMRVSFIQRALASRANAIRVPVDRIDPRAGARGPAKYQLAPVQTKATTNATVTAANDILTKLHWKPRAPGSILQFALVAPSAPLPVA